MSFSGPTAQDKIDKINSIGEPMGFKISIEPFKCSIRETFTYAAAKITCSFRLTHFVPADCVSFGIAQWKNSHPIIPVTFLIAESLTNRHGVSTTFTGERNQSAFTGTSNFLGPISSRSLILNSMLEAIQIFIHKWEGAMENP